MIDVCLCTHDPRREVLARTIASLAAQGAPPGAFSVLVVDNASTPPVDGSILDPLRQAGRPARLVREPRPGLTQARLRAIAETRGAWLLLLDDDNELRGDFVAEGLDFAAAHPEVGAFGGRLLLPPALAPPAWTRPFFPWLALKDAGDEPIVGSGERWGPWEPPGAGAWVRREVAEEFRRRFGDDPRALGLGRTGAGGLASCEDSLLVRQGLRLGLACAYAPRLVLYHHLDPARFRFGYLLRLMHAYGPSLVALELLVTGRAEMPAYYRGLHRLYKTIRRELKGWRTTSLRFAIAKSAFHWSSRAAYARAGRRGA